MRLQPTAQGRTGRAFLRGVILLTGILTTPCGSAEVYTGVGEYGVRWFSDVAPAANTPYQVVVLEAKPRPLESDGAKSAAVAGEVSDDPSGKTSPPTPDPLSHTGEAFRSVSGSATPPAKRPRAQRVSRAQRATAALEKRCQRYATALRKIRDQRRAGYSAAQDRNLRQRRQTLQEKQFNECSQVRTW